MITLSTWIVFTVAIGHSNVIFILRTLLTQISNSSLDNLIWINAVDMGLVQFSIIDLGIVRVTRVLFKIVILLRG